MKRTKEQKGITLVALIITIVVLLILAVVAVTAIQNDGILGHANNAATKYNQKQEGENSLLNDYENLLNTYRDEDLDFMKQYVIGNGEKLLTDILDDSTMLFLDDESTTDIDESTVVTYAGVGVNENTTKLYAYAKYNDKIYKIIADITTYTNENVERYSYNSNTDGLTEEEIAELDLLERYVLGEYKTGRSVTEIANIKLSSFSITSFINEEATIANASTTMEPLLMATNENCTKAHGYLKYNNKVYKIIANTAIYMTESLELTTYKPQGKEGTTVYYDGNGNGILEEWAVITDRNGKFEIVSKDAVGSLALSKADVNVTVTEDLDGNGTIGDTNDIAIASYNNAITTINNYCKSIVTATDNDGVRSVGASEDNNSSYSSPTFEEHFDGTMKSGDLSYTEDCLSMSYFGLMDTDAGFWLASRCTYYDGTNNEFGVRFSEGGTMPYKSILFEIREDGSLYFNNEQGPYGVRPIVINPTNITYEQPEEIELLSVTENS